MDRTLMGLLVVAVVVGATAAHADGYRGRRHRGHQAVAVQHDCGPRPTIAPAGTSFAHGQYQLHSVQRWVPPQQQQVFVPGRCHGRFNQRCAPGTWRWVTTPGRYETVQQWVWVPATWAPTPYGQHQSDPYGQYDQYGQYRGGSSAWGSVDDSGHAQVGVSFGYSTF